jgi:hypothetical protein
MKADPPSAIKHYCRNWKSAKAGLTTKDIHPPK